MSIVYPTPLRPGSRIVVTAPSSGVEPRLHRRLDLCLAHLRAQGFIVEEGSCLRDEAKSASASAGIRAAELMRTLLRDDVDAIIPPWGGELAIELLEHLDFQALQRAMPKWVLGYSDTSTWMLPITLPWQRYRLRFTLAGADAAWNYMRFEFLREDGALCASGYMKGAAVGRHGLVPNADSYGRMGLAFTPAELPAPVRHWLAAEAGVIAQRA